LNTTTAESYYARFRQVLEYIDTHLDEDLSVEKLSGIAAFSKYHFHRQFSELFGIGVYRYVQLCRLKRASQQLAFRSDSITNIALESGYEGPEAFARAFKKNIGQSPSEFRKQPQWEPWHATYQPLSELRSNHMKPQTLIEDIRIVNFPETRIAVLEHRGDLQRIGDTVRQFIVWRKLNHLPPKLSATYNLLYDDPATVAPEDFRMDICAATDKDIPANEHGVIAKTIPAGRCAVLRHTGSNDTLPATVHLLYAEWLPQSGEELRDFPLFFQRVKFFPDVAEHEAVTDVLLPLK
jgi:AraC family transcriptional regulator